MKAYVPLFVVGLAEIAKMANTAGNKSFHVPTDEELADLVGQMDSGNTKKSLKFARDKLLGFAAYSNTNLETGLDVPSDLDSFLTKFYAGVRKEDGTSYKKRTMQALRYGVQRHYMDESDWDITDKVKFPQSNRMFKAVMVSLKKQGKGFVEHKPVITSTDMQTMQNSEELDMTTPKGLQNKVFVDIMTFFCNRGRENIREMKPGDFTIETDVDSGLSYMKKKDCLTKNNREGQDEVSNSGRMYEIPNSNSCPLRAFQTYVSRLNAKCIWLWQRPKQAAPKDGSCWYCDSPLGVNTIGNKLKSISRNAGCSQVYTNHSLRATTINTLDTAGVQGRDIMSISGHKSETSLRHYSRTSDSRKRQMSGMLANHLYSVSGPEAESNTSSSSSSSTAYATSSTSTAPSASSTTTTSIISSSFSSSQETVAYGGDNSRPTSVEFSSSQSQIQQQSIQKVFHFHGCNVNIYNN